jgi:polyhydroxyalkanoate synthesis regulator phasin
MPQPKSPSSSSRSSSSRSTSSASRSTAAKKGAATRKAAANKRSATAKKGAATRKAAGRPAPEKAAVETAEGARVQLTQLRDTLRRGVVVTTGSLKEAMDDAVKRGQITRKDATALTQHIVSTGRAQADGFRASIEQLMGRGTSRAAQSGDAVLREVDRARRAVGVGPSFPITRYDDLSAADIQKRLNDLTPAELRKVRDYEKRHQNRKSVLAGVERKLGK